MIKDDQQKGKLMDEKVMFNLSYGLFVLTAKNGEKDNGCIVNTVIQVTSQPNRIIAVVNKANYTHDMIAETGEFNVSVLSEKAEFETFKHWGFQSGADTDKLIGIEYARSANGLIYLLNQVNSYMSAKVCDKIDLGTHTMFIADVTDGQVLSGDSSATYAYYHKNIKPSQKPAAKKGFICTVCGYVYEGEELPEDFICPLCKHPASDFKPLD